MAERIVLGVETSQITESPAEVVKKSLPKFLVLNAEPSGRWQYIQQALFMGLYLGGSGNSSTETWEFRDAFEFSYPSEE